MIAKRKADEYWMQRALSLAWRGAEDVRPNPRVGCVLVKEGRVIGEGYHARYGEAHAEAAALADAARQGESVAGADAYVTLEPCSHFGKTPPCAPRMAEAGVTRVVVGTVDPNPKVRGRGIEILKAAGIEVTLPCLEAECRWMNRGFFRSKTLGRPWITLKAAVGLDGGMALENGQSSWITGPEARTRAHLMRAEHDAVLVGVGTVIADNPELTVRHTCGKSPLRIILDTALSLPPDARVLKGSPGECLVLACVGGAEKKRRLEDMGAEVCLLPEENGVVSLHAALTELNARGVQMLMVEGGPRILSSFIKADLCDSLVLFMAGALLGEGRGLGSGLHFEGMDDIVRLRRTTVRRVGDDFLLEGMFRCSPAL